MGAYSPLPDVDDGLVAEVVARFHRPALAELARRGTPFRGALYAGLILTADRGPVLLEFNARLGDPEAQAILPRVAIPLAPLLLAAARGALDPAAGAPRFAGDVLPATSGAAVAIVLATRDYPAAPSAGDAITGLDAAAATGALVFHAGTRPAPDGGWETDGGRVLAVVGRGRDLAAARRAADRAADAVHFAGLRRRRDIAAGATR
jgi:phosphoribosylamine--glycine ligase